MGGSNPASRQSVFTDCKTKPFAMCVQFQVRRNVIPARYEAHPPLLSTVARLFAGCYPPRLLQLGLKHGTSMWIELSNSHYHMMAMSILRRISATMTYKIAREL
jgi:hypothetical protein